MQRNRSRQKMYLARYGRQDYFVWDDKDVQELDEAYDVLIELLNAEKDITTMEEDRG